MERMNSLAPSPLMNHEINDDIESETVSEAGDIGDRALRFSFEFTPEHGVLSVPGDQNLHALGSFSIVKSPAQPMTPHYNDIKGSPEHKNVSPILQLLSQFSCFYFNIIIIVCWPYVQEQNQGLPKILDYASCMIHLAAFGILGVIC